MEGPQASNRGTDQEVEVDKKDFLEEEILDPGLKNQMNFQILA
jgi:hypothetical protein